MSDHGLTDKIITLPTLATFKGEADDAYAKGSTSHAAYRTASIPYGSVDPTSTATVFTATVPGVDALYDGVTVMLHNGVVTSAANFTVNVNNLGAKPCYNNMTNATQETTIFNVAYTMMFVYSESLNGGNGGWWIYRGYDANTNTIGYQLRTNSSTLPASDKTYRYRLLFTSADGTHWVPANTSTSTSADTLKSVNSRAIDPFGDVAYYGTTSAVSAGANFSATSLWRQYTINLGYSFNWTGSALTLTFPAPVYLKCSPQSNGSVTMQGISQSMPSTVDGFVYMFLGYAYSATNVELMPYHPIYEYKNNAIHLWTNVNVEAPSGVTDYNELTSKPSIEGVTLVGDKSFPDLGIFIQPEEEYPQSDDYALTNVEITALWNAAS